MINQSSAPQSTPPMGRSHLSGGMDYQHLAYSYPHVMPQDHYAPGYGPPGQGTVSSLAPRGYDAVYYPQYTNSSVIAGGMSNQLGGYPGAPTAYTVSPIPTSPAYVLPPVTTHAGNIKAPPPETSSDAVNHHPSHPHATASPVHVHPQQVAHIPVGHHHQQPHQLQSMINMYLPHNGVNPGVTQVPSSSPSVDGSRLAPVQPVQYNTMEPEDEHIPRMHNM